MHAARWREVAAEVFVRAYHHLDINICVVRGGDDLLVVDSRSSPREGAELVADLQRFSPARVRALVNTHAHFDHTFGNQQFGPGSVLDVPIYGHHRLPAHLDLYERPRLAAWRAGTGGEPDRDWQDLRITVVEASGPPVYGSGCFPLQLPQQLACLLDAVDHTDVVIPGHGPVVDRAFIEAQYADVDRMAAQIRSAMLRGDTVEQALAEQDNWPFPTEGLQLAVERGYLALSSDNTQIT